MSNFQSKAIVVFSGGQDSTTCLFWAKKMFDEVEAVTFNYQQRHSLEIDVAKKIAKELDIKHHLLDMSLLNQLAPTALTRENIDIELKEGGLPSTFVPGRNLLFLTFASVLAKQLNAKHIVTGVCETDFSGYPDCRDVFIKSANVTINLALDEEMVIHTPLMWLNKMETWKLADELNGFDFIKNKTLTCYNGILAEGCGVCPACELRKKRPRRLFES
ncbi:7-cyano-7-deazaguanine synthase QueC [Bacillus carboniphilus]|uniref:7-cyano-7-deazaguanine synthase n=1 Tax=Bacillus carboniphilus TaxID=86663 RepID=A0ABY9JWJ0_9BACI|nr:7-cyano-7-deazaguanine synthase QueC [Bacillus carboniphilus]WLR43148.1 7-cyano-7-deazaguanine synthase QueC [Bacillus carboniphilus]